MPAGAVPGDPGHVDVESARGRPVRPAQAGAPRLVSGCRQVGNDDHGKTERHQGGRNYACRPLRHGSGACRSEWPGGAANSMFNPGIVYDAGFNEYLGSLRRGTGGVRQSHGTCGSLDAAGSRSSRRTSTTPRSGRPGFPGLHRGTDRHQRVLEDTAAGCRGRGAERLRRDGQPRASDVRRGRAARSRSLSTT